MVDKRFIEFEGAFNVRDLGGLPAAGGQRVRTGRVFRADSPNFLTEADRDRVAALDVARVIDLRSGDEATEGSWAVGPAMRRDLFEVIDPATSAEDSGVVIVDDEDFAQRYLRRLRLSGPRFVEAARTLIHSVDEGVIFHCSAGKDRTGLLAAFVLSALGVDRDLVVADYAASSEPMTRKFAFHKANPDSLTFDLSAVSPLLFESPAPVMERLLELADDAWGGIVPAFQQAGLTDDELVALRTALLVD